MMTDKFQHKYRIPSARAPWWDYSQNGAYFITICTQHRVHYFGEQNIFGPQSQNLASIVRGYKIGVTKFAHQIYADFAWQSRFHDHIVRDDEEYLRINHYIETNPHNWENDKFFNPDES
jgi:REP element-mobilizing transposase RayT